MPMKTCPYCANEINEAAIKCQFCHERLDAAPATARPATRPSARAPSPPVKTKPRTHPLLILYMVLGVVISGAMAAYCFTHGETVRAFATLVLIVPFLAISPVLWWTGDLFRRFAMPSLYFGSGAVDLAKQRLFWMVGPQSFCVGTFFVLCLVMAESADNIDFSSLKGMSAHATSAVAPTAAVQTSAASSAPTAVPASSATTTSAAAQAEAEAQFTGDLKFTDYPATAYVGPITLPDFNGAASDDADYRTVITDAVHGGVNFAGAYTVVEIGCGAGCRIDKIVDLRSGQISDLPVGGEANPDLMLDYKPDSALLEAQWDGDSGCARAFFQWTGQAFKQLQQQTAQGNCPDLGE